jgi:hypothetical protein
MTKLITTEERIRKAREFMQKAQQEPVISQGPFLDLGYVARVKDFIRQARDLVKYVQFQPSVDADTKHSVLELMQEMERLEKELLHT